MDIRTIGDVSAPNSQKERGQDVWDGLDTLMEADRCRREFQNIYKELCALEPHVQPAGLSNHWDVQCAYGQAMQDGHVREAIFHAKRLTYSCVLRREPEKAVEWAVCAFFLQLSA